MKETAIGVCIVLAAIAFSAAGFVVGLAAGLSVIGAIFALAAVLMIKRGSRGDPNASSDEG